MRTVSLVISVLAYLLIPATTNMAEFADLFFSSEADNDMNKSFREICIENKFSIEEYTVVTDDGYVLGLHRIPGILGDKQTKKPAVLLQHGMDSDAFQWVINSPEKAPAFDLVRAGYDVWLGNNRGCQFSVSHLTLDPSTKEFWNFDFEDMGTKDLPAIIDFIVEKTGQS